MGGFNFFVMSGVLMTYHYINQDMDCSPSACIQFSLKKMSKLYPLHIITLLLCLLYEVKDLLHSISVMSGLKIGGKLIINAFLFQSWVPSSEVFFSFNGLSWYLSTSLFVYACFPSLLVWLKKFDVQRAILLGGIVYIVQWALGYIANVLIHGQVFWFVYIFPVFRLGDFFIGCCAGKILLVLLERESRLSKNMHSIVEVCILFVFIVIQTTYIACYEQNEYTWMMTTLIYTPIAVCMVLMFAINKGIITKVLCNPFFVAVGIFRRIHIWYIR